MGDTAMRSIVILIVVSLVIGYACINERRGQEDPISEKSLRARIEDYYRCLNERNFKKVAEDYWYWEEEPSKEEIKEGAEDLGRIASYLRIENNIEAIKLKNDVAYVFGKMILYPLDENGDRYLEIWVFKKDRWYRQEDFISLNEDACKDFPIIFSNIQVEAINNTTAQISWETDEDVETEIAFWTDDEAKHPKRVSSTGAKKTHSVILSDLCDGEHYYYEIWAIRDNKRCHSKEGKFSFR